MSSGRGNAFAKTRTCPSSELLLLLSSGEPSSKTAAAGISRHLADCDFCAAELHFLATCPTAQELYQPVQMPSHLRRLAEDVFAERTNGADAGIHKLTANDARRRILDPGAIAF